MTDSERAGELRAFLMNDPEVRFAEQVQLRTLCTFRVGGEAEFCIWPESRDALRRVICRLRSLGIYYRVFGNGSNVLFDDRGFSGAAVFLTRLNHISRDGCRISAEAGVSVTQLAVYAQRAGLTGMEFLYGIPGSVGGAVYMNAGAYDGEIAGICERTFCYLPKEDRYTVHEREENDFGYRHSRFMENAELVTGADFLLAPGDPDVIRCRMEELMVRRRSKQPLEFGSAGSTFKRYPGTFTGKLIEDAGLKGVSIGGAQVSQKHAGFIINTGTATGADITALIRYVQDAVREKYGIGLECEVELIPFEKERH